ncbi:hypothetical protein BDN71DRAFT_79931 [Pleurotus eryngii]|uniref:Uncharacterized protein n=1 Tax=Pleurotus eryngii TaxID=5323 RepID=A0A9P6DD13_PLEER|nr:hypothetical protein BDN71DRAFT_79931 [Pleurotus eryngii]
MFSMEGRKGEQTRRGTYLHGQCNSDLPLYGLNFTNLSTDHCKINHIAKRCSKKLTYVISPGRATYIFSDIHWITVASLCFSNIRLRTSVVERVKVWGRGCVLSTACKHRKEKLTLDNLARRVRLQYARQPAKARRLKCSDDDNNRAARAK